jgi:hypothetical protein
LHEFFHLDLNDFTRGRFPLQKLVALVKSLMRKPGRSTLLMALDPTTEWTPEMYVSARSSDALELGNYLFLQANSAEDADIPMPEPIPRPGAPEAPAEEKPKPEEFATGQEVAQFFNRMNNL